MANVPDHFYRQSAALPFRRDRGKVEILLVTSRRKKRWVIPKGVRELDLDSASSAAKEALEEAGIEGDLTTPALGKYSYEKWGGVCTVEVFAMAVHTSYDVWPESYRDRFWFSPQEAAEKVDEPELKQLILDLAASLTSS